MKAILVIGVTFFLFLSHPVEAQTTANCKPVYGGGETCRQSERVSINKKVLNSNITFQSNQTYEDSDFVDHIDTTNKPYSPNQQTAFRLFVTNTSTRDLTNVTVEDILPPQHLTFVRGQGEYNEETRTFSATIDRLRPDETRAITIQVMTARVEELPAGTDTLCSVNQARATIGNDVSEDNSQLCMNRTGESPSPFPAVQGNQTQPTPQTTKGGTPVPNQTKGGLPVEKAPETQKTPDTGAELLLLTPLAGIGFFLRRKTA